MARTPEGIVKNKVVKILRDAGAYYFFPATGGYGKSGVPDIVACYRKRFIGIEVKADLNKRGVTPLQQVQLDLINDAGGLAMVVDAESVEAVRTMIYLIDEGNAE